MRAADLGARIINISAVTCLPANKTVDQTELGAALRYAAVEKDAVIIAAAGNNKARAESRFRMPVESAVGSGPSRGPAELGRRHGDLDSVVVAAVRTVRRLAQLLRQAVGVHHGRTLGGDRGARRKHHRRSETPTAAASRTLCRAIKGSSIRSTAPASPTAYVSGVAALVRSRFPELTAEQVIDRLTAGAQGAARAPSNLTGAGLVDPVASLTWDVNPASDLAGEPQPKPVAAPPQPAPPDSTPRTVAFVGTGVSGVDRRRHGGRRHA